jgi:hypothetical protein
MPKDEGDLLEVLKFDLIEETLGSWLRAIIRRLGREQSAIRRDQHKRATRSRKTLRGTPLHRKHHPKVAKPACRTALDRGAASSPDLGPIRFWQTRVKLALHSLP